MPAGAHPEIPSSWLNAEITGSCPPQRTLANLKHGGRGNLPMVLRSKISVTDNNFVFCVLQLSLSRVLWK